MAARIRPAPIRPKGAQILVIKHRALHRGAQGADGAELHCPLGRHMALGHGLEGKAEAAAHQGQRQNAAPLPAGLGQAWRLEQEGRPGRQQGAGSHLGNPHDQRIPLAGEHAGEQDPRRIEQGRRHRQQLSPAHASHAAP